MLPPKRTRTGATGLLAAFLIIGTAPQAAETRVYRCTSPDGGIELRQRPCPEGTEGDEILIEDRRTGWNPSTTEEGEKPKGTGGPGKPKRKSKKRNESAAKARHDEQCWKKRQLLKEVNWKLRRGYKPGKDVALRRKRETYEDYIRAFCP